MRERTKYESVLLCLFSGIFVIEPRREIVNYYFISCTKFNYKSFNSLRLPKKKNIYIYIYVASHKILLFYLRKTCVYLLVVT